MGKENRKCLTKQKQITNEKNEKQEYYTKLIVFFVNSYEISE
jgi:hypothetical protein